jgi:hypothetical protein
MDLPSWVTLPNLGTYSQDYSFDLNPLVISFSAGSNTNVVLLNGSLPIGLKWVQDDVSNFVTISGVAHPITSTINGQFTFRIIQTDGQLADRTFYLQLNPLPVLPSWENQEGFLGYQGNVNPSSYQLLATPPAGQHVTYGLLTTPTGMSINSITGLLTYNASVISTNASVIFNVRAYASSTSSDKDFSIDVVVNPLAPKWTTSSGSIGTYYGNDFIEFNFEATDVTGAGITYSLVSTPPEFSLSLSSTGVLYGRFENPVAETTWAFTVRAASTNGNSDRTFSVTLVPSDLYSLLVWETNADLGEIYEGQYIELLIKARTERRTTIVYSVVGGLLPPHLMLNSTGALMMGYVDYHAIGKTYMFDIRATDGYQTITRQFVLRIEKRYNDQFFGAYIPITGELREAWASDVSNIRAREPGTVTVNNIIDIIDPPFMNIVNGVVTGYKTPDQLVDQASPWLHTMDLRLGAVNNSHTITSSIVQTSDNVAVLSTLYREIVDQQNGANVSVYSQSVYNTNVQTNGMVYPISIENLRKAFVDDRGYITGGSGSGLVLQPVLDWNTGALIDALIIKNGTGYKSPPQLTITGSGTGAAAAAILGLIDVSIVNGGQNWQIGDIISIPGNPYGGLAKILVTQIGTNGSIGAVSIIDAGDYRQVLAVNTISIYQDGIAVCVIQPTWGIVAVNIASGGAGYGCGINIVTIGGEILPPWQSTYFPAMEIGKTPVVTANHAAGILNYETGSLWGSPWTPNYLVFKWEGLRWVGSTIFESDETGFDGDTTQFEETEDARLTVFDNQLTIFNTGSVTFDYYDPLYYDLWQTWGGTLIDEGTTVFDLYSTIFDALRPRRSSNTLVQKWITMQHRVYSGNNAVW